jgi:hypothetical protein
MIPENHVWVFTGGRPFPGGVFTTVATAESWISLHRLSGTLTANPLDEGCFDWAVRRGVTNLRAEKLTAKQADAAFIAGFSTASQEHFHYVDEQRA